MNRRAFIQTTLLASVLAYIKGAQALSHSRMPLLIMLELKGGNDFLNSLIPFAEPEYYKLRPTLGIPKSELDPLNSDIGIHKRLPLLTRLFKDKELAVVQGLGYENPSFSHFRSMDIWETGSDAREVITDGWANRALRQSHQHLRSVDAVAIGNSSLGPVRGLDERSFLLENPDRFINNYALQNINSDSLKNSSLSHIQSTQKNVNNTYQSVKELPGMKDVEFSGDQLIISTRIVKTILNGMPDLPFMKFTQEGFDTHADQMSSHLTLLSLLNESLEMLVSYLKTSGKWNDTLIVTYSEFGRGPRENFSAGTDHGTSSCQFVMGGRVKGGLYGSYPSFKEIDDFHFKATLDYRNLLSTIIQDFWKLDSEKVFGRKFETLDFIKS